MTLGICVPCVAVVYAVLWLYFVPGMGVFDALDMAGGRTKTLLASNPRSAKKKTLGGFTHHPLEEENCQQLHTD